MIIALRALLDQLEAVNKALTMHGSALRQLANDLESGDIERREAAILLRLLAEETAYAASPTPSRPPRTTPKKP